MSSGFRRLTRHILLPLLMVLAMNPILAAENAIVAPGATLQHLADNLAFAEGPACDRDGNVFFTDQPNDRILEWSVEGKLLTFMQPCGRANGLCFDGEGNLWACADQTNALWRIRPDRSVEVMVSDFGGKLLNGPNDVWITPAGGVYITDPYYKRDYWKRGGKELPESVYYLPPSHKGLQRVIDDFRQPNGIIGTPDGTLLYVSDIGAHKTFRYRIAPDGSLTDKTLFCQLGSDGMTIDDQGNVYLTGRGVTVFNPAGEQIEHINIEQPWTGNICFGGKDRHTLFITASKSLYSLQMRVKGVGSQ